jgi:hypothetical protein
VNLIGSAERQLYCSHKARVGRGICSYSSLRRNECSIYLVPIMNYFAQRRFSFNLLAMPHNSRRPARSWDNHSTMLTWSEPSWHHDSACRIVYSPPTFSIIQSNPGNHKGSFCVCIIKNTNRKHNRINRLPRYITPNMHSTMKRSRRAPGYP